MRKINKITKDLGRFKKAISDMSFEEKEYIINRINVKIPRAISILDDIEECLESYDGETDPDHLLIYGESRLGKTTITKTFKRLHPPIITDTDNRIPVLWVGTPVPATMDSLVTEALETLGDDMADKGKQNLGKKKRRLVKLLIKLRVELIIWDEFQHILEATTTNPELVANWVKDLMNKVPVAMVMIGMPGSLSVVQGNAQLNNRISERIEMNCFGWKTKAEKKSLSACFWKSINAFLLKIWSGSSTAICPIDFSMPPAATSDT